MIGLSVSVSNPALSDLFNELAEEEKLHGKQIELMQNIFLQSKDAFLENPEAETTHRRIRAERGNGASVISTKSTRS